MQLHRSAPHRRAPLRANAVRLLALFLTLGTPLVWASAASPRGSLHASGARSSVASNAMMTASLTYDSVSANGFAPNGSVTFTIRSSPGGAVLASGTRAATAWGWAAFARGGDHDVDLVAGMHVTATDGTTTKELTLEPLAITVLEPEVDAISGSAGAGGEVGVSFYTPTSTSPTLFVTADSTGGWRADFAGLADVTGLATATAFVRDADNDETVVSRRPSIVSASLSSDYIGADGFTASHTVTFTIRESPAGVVLASGSRTTDGAGAAFFSRGADFSIDLRPGLEITVTDGTQTKVLTLTALEVTRVDPAADVVAGTAPPGAIVEAYVYNMSGYGSPIRQTTAASDGTWTVDFSGTFDINGTANANVLVRDADGDATTVFKQPAVLSAQLASNSFWASAFGANKTLSYTIRSAPDGTVLASGSKTADAWGWASFGGAADLVPGQELTVTDGATTKTLVLANIKIVSIDASEDVVSGTAPPGAEVDVSASRAGSYAPAKHVTAAADGAWQVDFTGSFDLDYGMTVTATVRDADGDATIADRYPAVLTASLTWNSAVTSGFAPDADVGFTIRQSPEGPTVDSGIVKTTATGYAYFTSKVDLVGGMQVTASDGATTKQLTLAPLAITRVDSATDTVAGTAAAGTQVRVLVYAAGGAGSPTLEGIAGADGRWRADFSGVFDIQSATAIASTRDADGDATEVTRQPSTISAWLSTDSISAYGFDANRSVTLTIRAAPGGTVLASVVKSTDELGSVWFGRHTDFGVDLTPGRHVTATDGETTKELTLANVTVGSVDQSAEVVTGTAAPRAAVEVVASDSWGSAVMTVTADEDGAWRADFTGVHDLGHLTNLSASVSDEDGDWTGTSRRPPLLWASLSYDEIQVANFAPDSEVAVTVRSAPAGAVLFTGVVATSDAGWALIERATHRLDLKSGMHVTATDGMNTKELTLAPLVIETIDAEADSVSGTAPSGGQVHVFVPDSPTLDVTAGADGAWIADFSGVFDVIDGSWANAWIDDAEGDTTATTRWPPLDTQPPRIEVPDTVISDATSPDGVFVTYTVTATDDVDPQPTVTCTPASGATFGIGDTTVRCRATDAAGHVADAEFVVHVRGAQEQLDRLKTAVVGVGPGVSLRQRVIAASTALAVDDKTTALAILNAFQNEVRAQSVKSIPAGQAADLVAAAQRIISAIG